MITISNLCKTYFPGQENEVHALTDVSLNIPDGEMIAVVGPSGSGKSTLLHILGFLEKADSGTYFLNESDVSNLPDAQASLTRNTEVGIVLQDYGIIPTLSVKDNLELPLLIAKKSRKVIKEAVIDAAMQVKIEDKLSVKAGLLSGGQQQRVAIARALIINPKLILADEPTGALDRQTTIDIINLLKEINNNTGCTMIIATHDPIVAEACDRIVRLVDGSVA